MLSAMHVVCAPQHHLDRMDWMNALISKAKLDSRLMDEIAGCGKQTWNWAVIMTALCRDSWDIAIPEAITRLEKTPVNELNRLLKEYDRPPVKTKYKEYLCRIMKEFHDSFFCKELTLSETIIIRLMKREQARCENMGLYPYISTLHERIRITETELVFIKNKHYIFALDDINEIVVLGNSFISPHLLVEWDAQKVCLPRMFTVEKDKRTVPQDLIKLLKGLGDETRLRILYEIGRGQRCTQELAPLLNVSEACVSKHLKLLYESGILKKGRKGNFVFYSIDTEKIDFIPYSLYEFIMRIR